MPADAAFSAAAPGAPKVLVVLESRIASERLAERLAEVGLGATLLRDAGDIPAVADIPAHRAVVTRTAMIAGVREATGLPIVNLEIFMRQAEASSAARFDGRAFMDRMKGVVAFG